MEREELTEVCPVRDPVGVIAEDFVEVEDRVARGERVAWGEGEVEEEVDTVNVAAEELDATPEPEEVGDRVPESGVCVGVVEGEPLRVPTGDGVVEMVTAMGVTEGDPVPTPTPGVPVPAHTLTVPPLVREGGPGVTVRDLCPDRVPDCVGVEAFPAVRVATKGVFEAALDTEGGGERDRDASMEREGVVLIEELTLTLGDTAPVPGPPASP